MKLEDLAGSSAQAFEHLAAFLALFEETDYSRPLVREGDGAISLLQRYLATDTGSANKQVAERLMEATGERHVGTIPHLTDREIEVLARLDEHRDDDIAAALGISRHGVRFHVGNILRKLGSRGRRQATQRARALGIVLPVD